MNVAADGRGARGTIRVLPDDLANQIAAGEVVERPASVVKELCENALDAGATRVEIAIEGGGVISTSVADDGSGIPEIELELAVQRHATSKIASLEDLAAIGSFGFRGEALPSIASVSRFRIESRVPGEQAGAALSVDGGGPAELAPLGMPRGTRVVVRDLFFNVPARRKFLRALATESANVTDVVEHVALGAPHVTVTLDRDGRRVREILRAESRAARVASVLEGWELARCVGSRGPLSVEAYLSRPEKARVGAGSLRMFVNGRPIKDRALARAVAHAYGGMLDGGRFPVGVVYLDLPAHLVDVNVHPQKSEVRFADGRAIGDAVYRIVESCLGVEFTGQLGLSTRGAPPRASGGAGGPALGAAPSDAREIVWSGAGELPPRDAPAAPASTSPAPPPVPYPTLGPHPGSHFDTDAVPKGARFLAQTQLTFLVCETDDALLILDQHAAAERVTFDRLKRAVEGRSIAMQTLLVPEVIEVGAEAAALVEEIHDTALSMGLDLRPAGGARVSVHAVPQLLVRARPERLVTAILGELSRAGGPGFRAAIDLALATMACHGSIRAGDRVSPEEAAALLAALADVRFGGHCPHGRPIVTRLSFRELEHRVGRR
ncbi:MAG TPA: DNA mismatch repair endonuclease MutL [Polyangiaceae bacterium]|nr:DNA mismatch repair endonuclease MutL [Polyangiaceae bacterium]